MSLAAKNTGQKAWPEDQLEWDLHLSWRCSVTMASDTPASHAVVSGSEGGALQGNKKVQVLPRYQRLEMKLVLNHEQGWDHDLDHGLLALGSPVTQEF